MCVFIMKIGESERDAVHYIQNPFKFECNHYFSGLTFYGACFSTHYTLDKIIKWFQDDEIKTILSLDDFKALYAVQEYICGYGIIKDSDRYNDCITKIESISYILDKLKSEENEKLISEVKKKEIGFIYDKYNIDENGYNTIIDNYGLDYWDNGIISYVYNSYLELGEEYFDLCGISDNPSVHMYIDYEKFGEDIAEDDRFILLLDGTIIECNC
jgi:hypothetical protein